METSSTRELRNEIWLAAAKHGHTKSTCAFLVAQRSPQGGWYVVPASDYMQAESTALNGKVKGIERYVVSANDQHGIQHIVDGKLVDLA